MSTRDKCGTAAGYQQHRRRKEDACPECRAANAQYKRELLARNPAAYANQRAYGAAWQRAAKGLVDRYRDEFEELLAAELERAS